MSRSLTVVRLVTRTAAVLSLGTVFAAGAQIDQLAPLPEPDLGAVEPVVRQQLEEARLAMTALIGETDTDPIALARGFGHLGRLYLTYSLLNSAESCFGNALALTPEEFRWNYYLAVILQRTGRFDRAAEHLATALTAQPRDLATLIRLGQVEIGRDRPDSAATFFERALSLDSAAAAALYGLGQVAYSRKEFEQAVDLFRTAVAAQPDATTAHYQLGLAYRQLGDLDRAREHLARQGRTEVSFPDPLLTSLTNLARGASVRIAQATRASGQGDLHSAQLALEAAQREDPDNITARLALASNFIKQGKLEQAVTTLEKAVARDPENAAAHYNLGTVLARMDRKQEGLDALRQATSILPDFADAQVNLAGLLRRMERYDEAAKVYALALELNPGDVALEIHRAETLHQQGMTKEAAAALSVAAGKVGDDPELLLLIGQAFEATGQADQAKTSYRAASVLETQPKAAALGAKSLASLLTSAGDLTGALTALDAAVELDPERLESLHQRALVNGQLRRFTDAAADFALVLERAPRDPAARMGRAAALLVAEDYPAALIHLQESVAVLPENVPLLHTLARLLATCPDPAVRDGDRALELAQEVGRRQRDLEHGQTIAMALAELGRFEDAIGLQSQLVAFARQSGQTGHLTKMERRLELYQRGQAERAPWLQGTAN